MSEKYNIPEMNKAYVNNDTRYKRAPAKGTATIVIYLPLF